jgi:lysophospholipase L1-like esterase
MACMESESIVVRPGGAWTSDGKLLAHDGVHPNARGNRLLAELIAQGISRSIKDR